MAQAHSKAIARKRLPSWPVIRKELRVNLPLLALALPGLIHILLFQYATLPFLLVAFKSYRPALGLWDSPWVGFRNFEFLFTGTGKGWEIIRNVLLYNSTFIILGTVFALAIAIMLAEVHHSRLSRIYRTSLFLPQFISWVIIAYIVLAFFDRDQGMINAMLRSAGANPVNWYGTSEAWPPILVAAHLWRTVGLGSVVYLAGILRINPELFEAAAVDGANRWQQIRFITLPSLMPLVIVLTLLSIGNIFRADFGLFYQVPRQYANPLLIGSTDVIDTFVVRALSNSGQIELATAAGFFQSFVGLVLVVFINSIVRRVNPERALF